MMRDVVLDAVVVCVLLGVAILGIVIILAALLWFRRELTEFLDTRRRLKEMAKEPGIDKKSKKS